MPLMGEDKHKIIGEYNLWHSSVTKNETKKNWKYIGSMISVMLAVITMFYAKYNYEKSVTNSIYTSHTDFYFSIDIVLENKDSVLGNQLKNSAAREHKNTLENWFFENFKHFHAIILFSEDMPKFGIGFVHRDIAYIKDRFLTASYDQKKNTLFFQFKNIKSTQIVDHSRIASLLDLCNSDVYIDTDLSKEGYFLPINYEGLNISISTKKGYYLNFGHYKKASTLSYAWSTKSKEGNCWQTEFNF